MKVFSLRKYVAWYLRDLAELIEGPMFDYYGYEFIQQQCDDIFKDIKNLKSNINIFDGQEQVVLEVNGYYISDEWCVEPEEEIK